MSISHSNYILYIYIHYTIHIDISKFPYRVRSPWRAVPVQPVVGFAANPVDPVSSGGATLRFENVHVSKNRSVSIHMWMYVLKSRCLDVHVSIYIYIYYIQNIHIYILYIYIQYIYIQYIYIQYIYMYPIYIYPIYIYISNIYIYPIYIYIQYIYTIKYIYIIL
jgi:hypothetical protein